MKRLLIAVAIVVSALSVSLDAFAEQKIVECGERYRCTEKWVPEFLARLVCSEVCNTPTIEDYLKDGWKIDSTQPTSFTPNINADSAKKLGVYLFENHLLDGSGSPPKSAADTTEIATAVSQYCQCLGAKYVLSKEEKKTEVAPEPDKNFELLKKEIELIKKENDILKKDVEALKQENEVLKKKAAKKK